MAGRFTILTALTCLTTKRLVITASGLLKVSVVPLMNSLAAHLAAAWDSIGSIEDWGLMRKCFQIYNPAGIGRGDLKLLEVPGASVLYANSSF